MRDCQVCADVRRDAIESAYLRGDAAARYGHPRAVIESHMAHAMTPAALQAIADLTSAASIAARLRMLEGQATAILDAAIADGSGRLAIQALREVRATIETIAKVAGHLNESIGQDNARPDIDARIAQALDNRFGHSESPRPAQWDGPRAINAPKDE
jgi:hypothetical protein